MPLTLRAVSLNDQPITQPITAQFGAQGGSIGRADTNTLALARSRAPHLAPSGRDRSPSGAGYVIKNVGSANPIIVRDQSLALGESAPLRARRSGADRRLSARSARRMTPRATTEPRVDAAAPPAPIRSLRRWRPPGMAAGVAGKPRRAAAPAFPPSSPFADLGAPVSAGNPFAELLGGPSPARARRRPLPQRLAAGAEPAARRLRSVRAAARRRPRRAARPSTSGAGGAFEDLIPSAAPGIDRLAVRS